MICTDVLQPLHHRIETRIHEGYTISAIPPTALFGPSDSAAPVTFSHAILDQQQPIIELENHPWSLHLLGHTLNPGFIRKRQRSSLLFLEALLNFPLADER